MNYESTLAEAVKFRDSLDTIMTGVEILGDPRNRLFNAYYHLASEHFCSLVHLLELNFYASAGAILRSQYEATIRGVYFHEYASDKALEKFISGKSTPTLATLIGDISSKLEKKKNSSFYRFFHKTETMMNEFNHGGMAQINRRFTQTGLVNNYSGNDKIILVSTSHMLAKISISCALDAAGKKIEAEQLVYQV